MFDTEKFTHLLERQAAHGWQLYFATYIDDPSTERKAYDCVYLKLTSHSNKLGTTQQLHVTMPGCLENYLQAHFQINSLMESQGYLYGRCPDCPEFPVHIYTHADDDVLELAFYNNGQPCLVLFFDPDE